MDDGSVHRKGPHKVLSQALIGRTWEGAFIKDAHTRAGPCSVAQRFVPGGSCSKTTFYLGNA